jgi:hypothetical protein
MPWLPTSGLPLGRQRETLRDTNGLASRRMGALSTTHATDLMLGIGCHVSPSDPIEGKGRRKRDYESFVGETAPAVDHPCDPATLGLRVGAFPRAPPSGGATGRPVI